MITPTRQTGAGHINGGALLALGLSLMLCACSNRSAPPPPPQMLDASAPAAPATIVPKPAEAPRASAPVVPPAPPNAADLARIENLVAPALREGLTLVAANALAQASERALETGPSGRPAPWAGDGLSGAITPQPLRRMAKSAQCRTYIQSQGTKTAEAVACKTPGGTWAMVAPKSGR